MGLDLRWAKCKLLWQNLPEDQMPDEVRARFETLGIQIHFGTTELLGTPIGTEEDTQVILEQAVVNHRTFFDSIKYGNIPASVAERLLRLCGVPRMNYITRTNYPSDLVEALTTFDLEVQQTAQLLRQHAREDEVAPLNYGRLARRRNRQPFRHAGMGLRSMLSIVDFAFFGSIANCANRIYPSIVALCAVQGRFSRQLELTLARINNLTGEDVRGLIPPPESSGDQCMQFYHEGPGRDMEHLQRQLTHSFERKAADELFNDSTPAQRATMVASGAPWANTFVCAPLEHMLSLPHDNAHRVYSSLRLGLAPATLIPGQICFCEHDMTGDPWHFLCCNRLKATALTYRHDLVVQTVAEWVRRAGGSTQIEPRGLWAQEDGGLGRRPDIRVVLGGLVFLLDIAVVHPTTASRLGTPMSMHPLATEEAMERIKRNRYDGLARLARASFIPFVVETFGGFGACARRFCSRLARFAEGATREYTRTDLLMGIRSGVALAVQRGNADIIRVGLQRSSNMQTRRWDGIKLRGVRVTLDLRHLARKVVRF